MFIGNDSKHVLVEMLHSCTPETNKDNILESFHRVVEITVGEGVGENSTASLALLTCGKKMSDLINSSYF